MGRAGYRIHFIFLDVGRAKRCWVILPFSVAVLLLMSHQYELDPVLVLMSQSETTPFRLIRVREPYVRRLLLQRAVGLLGLIALVTAALTVLFVFVLSQAVGSSMIGYKSRRWYDGQVQVA